MKGSGWSGLTLSGCRRHVPNFMAVHPNVAKIELCGWELVESLKSARFEYYRWYSGADI